MQQIGSEVRVVINLIYTGKTEQIARARLHVAEERAIADARKQLEKEGRDPGTLEMTFEVISSSVKWQAWEDFTEKQRLILAERKDEELYDEKGCWVATKVFRP